MLKPRDYSIIDITGLSCEINSNNILENNVLEKYIEGVPYWAHQYVCSHSEINSASYEQRKFYFLFKKSFLSGKCFDLEGHTNYAFILLYDLLNDYDTHKNISELEHQLKLLSKCYPVIEPDCNSSLARKMNLIKDPNEHSNERSNEYPDKIPKTEETPSYGQFSYGLGNRHMKTLNLNPIEVALLNNLRYTSNGFNGISYCMIEIVKIYLEVCHRLEQIFFEEQTTLSLEFERIVNIILERKSRGYYHYYKEPIMASFYTTIFKCCENAVRECYKHRTLDIDCSFAENAKQEYEEKILSKVTAIIPDVIDRITPITEEIEMILFAKSTTRWREYYKKIKKNYKKNVELFADKVVKLGKLNKFNLGGSEKMFYDAASFAVERGSESAVKLYFLYLSEAIYKYKILTERRLTTLVIDKKLKEAQRMLKRKAPVVTELFELNMSLTKNVLKTEEQTRIFYAIFREYIRNKKVQIAIEKIPDIFRKKIKLNDESVLEIKQQHFGTVELLNEYLKENEDLKEDEDTDLCADKNTVSEEKQSAQIQFSQIQASALDFFEKNNFTVLQSEFEAFAKLKGVLKNQLIDSINETCYEQLDDNLIETEDEHYVINQDYIKQCWRQNDRKY